VRSISCSVMPATVRLHSNKRGFCISSMPISSHLFLAVGQKLQQMQRVGCANTNCLQHFVNAVAAFAFSTRSAWGSTRLVPPLMANSSFRNTVSASTPGFF